MPCPRGWLTGSSQNKQPWRFILIREPSTLRAIAEAGLPHTRSLTTAEAAIAIVLPQAPGSGISHGYDEGRAAERILIAATLLELGAGISWIASEARPVIAALLGLREDRFVRTIAAIGHPTDAAQEPKKPRGQARLPREETVFNERWPRYESRSQIPVSRSAARAPSWQVSTTLTNRRSSSPTP